jgi:hypothetical protein
MKTKDFTGLLVLFGVIAQVIAFLLGNILFTFILGISWVIPARFYWEIQFKEKWGIE